MSGNQLNSKNIPTMPSSKHKGTANTKLHQEPDTEDNFSDRRHEYFSSQDVDTSGIFPTMHSGIRKKLASSTICQGWKTYKTIFINSKN
jgi:hypothetical protein